MRACRRDARPEPVSAFSTHGSHGRPHIEDTAHRQHPPIPPTANGGLFGNDPDVTSKQVEQSA